MPNCRHWIGVLAAVLPLAMAAAAEDDLLLLDGRSVPLARLTPGKDVQLSVDRSADRPGLLLTVAPGDESYPGVTLKPEGDVWDLSAYGHVEALVTNVGQAAGTLALRVDNAVPGQQDTWNTEQATLQPGEAIRIRVYFGHQYGHKPGYPLDPAKVVSLLLFALKGAQEQVYRVESVVAGGPAGEQPPVDPRSLRTTPVEGHLFGGAAPFDAATQTEAKAPASVTRDPEGLALAWPEGTGERWVSLTPERWRWDLRSGSELRVRLKNSGLEPSAVKVVVLSDGGSTDAITSGAVPAGGEVELVVPFQAAVPWRAEPIGADGKAPKTVPGSGSSFRSDAASSVRVSAPDTKAGRWLLRSVTVGATPAVLPEWLGKRPPVPGDWTQTLDTNFDGNALDERAWQLYGPNYWDKVSRWSRDNVVVADGKATLIYERKTGHHNDDPKAEEKRYTSGYLDTYGKWVQRYGYFEARVKPATAPGLWPAVWMMPDRGVNVGEQWQRADTGNGGMEFDIYEHLTRWGPYRYNIALHWDGYGDKHRSIGTQNLYAPTDADGWLTTGLLWLPGQVVFYANGVEVGRWEDPRVASVPANFIVTFVAGGWDNDRVVDQALPARFEVDYIRAWQRADLASPVDGYQVQPAR